MADAFVWVMATLKGFIAAYLAILGAQRAGLRGWQLTGIAYLAFSFVSQIALVLGRLVIG